MSFKFTKLRLGFTLIELLVVIAIIGILAVAFVPQMLGAPAKARDAQRIADLKKLSDFITYHYNASTSGVTFPLPFWYCIKFEDNPLALSLNKFIKDNLDSLSGVFPEQPDSTWSPYYGSSQSDWCDGGYGSYWPNSGPYKASIFTKIEIPANANSISASSITPGANNVNNVYYTIMIQK